MWWALLWLTGCESVPPAPVPPAVDLTDCSDIEGATKTSVTSRLLGEAVVVPCRDVVWWRPLLLPGRSEGDPGSLAIGSSTDFRLDGGVDGSPDTWPQVVGASGEVDEERAVVYFRDIDPEADGIQVLERMPGFDVEVPTMVDWERLVPNASVHVAGQWADMDNDGIEDLLLQGAPDFQTSWLPGTASGLSVVPPSEALGFPAMALGDLTGDGVTDLGRLDTVPDGAVNDDGEALVLSVQPMPVVGSLVDAPWGIQLGTDLYDRDNWGSASRSADESVVQGGFDHNGDGIADVVVGNEFAGDPRPETGSISVFDGPIDGSRTGDEVDALVSRFDADCSRQDGGPLCDSVGSYVKSAGDLDGDGYEDLLVGSQHSWTGALRHNGALYVVPGPLHGSMNLYEVSAARLDGGYDWAEFPDYMQGRGDLDGDGRSDLVVAQADTREEGGMVVHHGPVEGVQHWQDGTRICDRFDYDGQVRFDTDIDGDGVDDLVYSSPLGGVHLWYSTISMEYPRPDSDCFL